MDVGWEGERKGWRKRKKIPGLFKRLAKIFAMDYHDSALEAQWG